MRGKFGVLPDDGLDTNWLERYLAKKLESKKAKHRRYWLKEKVIYGGIERVNDFVERLYIKGEEKLSLARNLLLISDGRDGLVILPGLIILKLPTNLIGGTTRRS